MFFRYCLAMVITFLMIFIAIILGDYGAWYLSWVLGTGFMILVAAFGGVLFDVQEEAAQTAAEAASKDAGSRR